MFNGLWTAEPSDLNFLIRPMLVFLIASKYNPQEAMPIVIDKLCIVYYSMHICEFDSVREGFLCIDVGFMCEYAVFLECKFILLNMIFYRLLQQCKQYFELECLLLAHLSGKLLYGFNLLCCLWIFSCFICLLFMGITVSCVKEIQI